MAIITTEEINYLASLLGDAYQDGLDSYGDTDTPDTVNYDISRAKVYVRGGTEARNGIRATTFDSNNDVLDLQPSISTTTVTVRRGRFYIADYLNELYNDRSFSFAFDDDFWMSVGLSEATWDELRTDLIANTAKAITARRSKALIYASDEPISDATTDEMESYIVFNTTHADLRINASTDWFAAEFKPTANTTSVYLDKVKLYISANGSPNTGLICEVYANNSGVPDTASGAVFSSFQVDTGINSDGGWVDFVFENPTALTGGNVYWLIVRPGTPSGGVSSNLSGSVYYSWHFKGTPYINGTNDDLLPSTDGGSTWGADIGATGGGGAGITPAIQFITYLKVIYTGIIAEFDSSTTGHPTNSDITNTLVAPTPSAKDYANVCDVTLATNSGAYSDGVLPITTTVSISDIRRIVAFEGLEDDDKMSVIFPGIDATEDEIEKVSTEQNINPLATSFSATVSALNTHISTLSSGNTFKTYWRNLENYFERPFRKIWYANTREELVIDFGTFTADGSNARKYTDPSDGWVTNDAWVANMNTGVGLEVYNPSITTGTALLKVFGITISYTTLTSDLTASGDANFLCVADPSLFTANDYIWVQRWNGSFFNGDLLKILAISGNLITVGSGENGVCNGYTTYDHFIGDRVYLVDDVELTIDNATAARTRTTVTPTITGTKYLNVAFLQPKYNGTYYGGSGDRFVVRSV